MKVEKAIVVFEIRALNFLKLQSFIQIQKSLNLGQNNA